MVTTLPTPENPPDTSKWRPLYVALIVLSFALAVVNAIRFRHGHDPVDAVSAGVFLVIAVLFVFRSRRAGEPQTKPQIAQLDIQGSGQRKS
jgi:hypothetical protein